MKVNVSPTRMALLWVIFIGVFILDYASLQAAENSIDLPQSAPSLETQLCNAIFSRTEGKALELVAAGANVNARVDVTCSKYAREEPEGNLTMLHLAAENDLEKLVKALVSKGAKLEAEVTNFRGSPLVIALARGSESTARYLLEQGANAQYVDSGGFTPLHVGAGRCSLPILELLISKGADVNRVNGIGKTPLFYALDRERWSNAKFLIAQGADIHGHIGEGPALNVAAKRGGLELVELLIAKGVDVNGQDYSGETALHRAARSGYKDIAALLVAKGANVNAPGVSIDGKRNGPPILSAAYRGYLDIIQLLYAHGADLNLLDATGNSALMSAASGGYRVLVEWLVNHGAT